MLLIMCHVRFLLDGRFDRKEIQDSCRWRRQSQDVLTVEGLDYK